jgi:hypothetical protein
MKHHEIEITVDGKSVRPPSPMPVLFVGDTVRYFSRHDGEVVIQFPERSPYRTDNRMKTQVTGAATLAVMQDGLFKSGCQLELSDGTVIGWNPLDPVGTKDFGGDHDVRKPP